MSCFLLCYKIRNACLWTALMQSLNEVLYNFLTVVPPNCLGSGEGTIQKGPPLPRGHVRSAAMQGLRRF